MKINTKIIASILFFAVISSCSSGGSGASNGALSSPVPVTSITMNKSETAILKGDTETLYAQVWQTNATNQGIIWSSSDTSIAQVANNGEVSAISEGKAVITATSSDGNRTAVCSVNVASAYIPATAVALTAATQNIGVNSSIQIFATFSPQNATNQKLRWSSSDPDIISVSKGGVITGLKKGTSIITITSDDGSRTAAMTITVTDIPVTGITISKSSTNIEVNGTEQLSAAISPANASVGDITWKSSDSSIVSVNGTGLITGEKAGSAAITVESVSSGQKAECAVTVTSSVIAVTGVTISSTTIPVPFNVGTNGQINASIAPSNATSQSITWTSSDSSVVNVNQAGKITGMGVGSATIYAESSDGLFKASYSVTVDPVAVSGITITSSVTSVKVGSTATLTASISPANATYNSITWTSSNQSAAAIDSATGIVSGIATGQSVITAASYDGKAADTVTIFVSEAKANDDNISVQQGSTTTIAASSLLSNDTGSQLSFTGIVSGSEINCSASVSNSIVSVTSTGVAGEAASFQYQITDVAGGKATATVYLSVSPLAAISAYIYEDEALFNAKKAAYVPPTMKDIFNTWGRFNSNSYWSVGTSATGDAASWTLIADENNDGLIDSKNAAYFDSTMGNNSSAKSRIYGDMDSDSVFDARVMQTANTTALNGFISPETFESYSLEVTLWSSDPSDDDMLGLVAAFYHDGATNGSGGTNHTLYFARTRGGWAPRSGWGLMLDSAEIVNIPIGAVTAGSNWGGTYSGNLDLNGSDDVASRVKIVRSGDIITAYCTTWITGVTNFKNPPAYDASSMIEINLASATNNIRYYSAGVTTYASRDLTGFRGAKAYGYTTQSSAMSTYLNVEFSGGLKSDTLVLLKNKDASANIWSTSEVWKYASGAWAVQNGSTIQSELGFVRSATNPDTSLTYTIKRLLTKR